MKKKHSKLIVFSSLVFIVLTGLFIVNLSKSFAADTTDLPQTMTSKALDPSNPDNFVNFFSVDNDHMLRNSAKYLVDTNNNEYVAYCLEHDKNWGTGLTFTKSQTALDPGYAYIMLNGAPIKSLTGNSKDDIYLTQVALWLYQDRRDGIGDNQDGTLDAVNKSAIVNSGYYTPYIKPLVDGALNARSTGVTPNPQISILASDFKYQKINGVDYLVTDPISFTTNVSFENYKLSLNISNYEILDEDNNVMTKVQNDNPVTSIAVSSNKKFKIRIPLNQTLQTTNITMSMLISYTQYDAYLYTPDSSHTNFQEVSVSTLQANTKTKAIVKSITLPLGNLTIKKEKVGGGNLAGAQLRVTNSNGYNSGILTTSLTPITLSNLIPGTYVVEEITAPSGYVVTSSAEVSVVAGGTSTAKLIDPETKLTIRKVDAEDNTQTVSGAKIAVYDVDDTSFSNPIATFTSDSEPYVLTGVLECNHSYYVKEIKPAPGYILDPTVKRINITPTTYDITVTLQNLKNETEIIKIDPEGNMLAGVTLALYKVGTGTDQLIERWTTTTEAHSLRTLLEGDYYVVEEAVPDEYVLSEGRATFHIDENQIETQTVAFTNAKKGVVINKKDADTGVPVPGTKLRIRNTNGSYNRVITTTTQSTVLEGLPNGHYVVTEEEAADGYIKSNEEVTFDVTNTTQNLLVEFENVKNKLNIAKIDEDTNEYLAGAQFVLKNSSGTVIDTWTSDSGVHTVSVVNLPHGTYKLQEVKAPAGYMLDSTIRTITIDENSDNTYIYKMKNKKMDVRVNKVDENNQPFAGVELELLDSNKNRVKSWVTTTSSKVLDGLEPGQYYIRETATVPGYILDDTLHPFTIRNVSTTQTITIQNVPITIELAKIDATTDELIKGAKLKLSRQDGTITPITWTTDGTKKVIKKLTAGTYILEEVEEASGYIGMGNKIVFEVLNTGKVQTVYMKDNYIKVSINNKKLTVDTDGQEGFKFVLKKSDGTKVVEWNSSSTAYTTSTLALGDYILTEEEVPEGYVKVSVPYKFSITNDTTSTVKLINSATSVYVSKKDFTNGKEVPGAKLILKNNDGELIEEWTSTNEPHNIRKLPVGKYNLTEILAPDDYVLSTETVEFEVKNTGDIQTTQMYNEPKVKIPDTLATNSKTIYIISFILVGLGIGIGLYSVKRKA